LTSAIALAAACASTEPGSQRKGYGVSGQDPFRFEVERELLREWGGPESPRFNQVLEDELERLRLCRNGYVLRNEGVREGIFRATGRCKS
jgi:hypothetical protein